MLSPTVCRELHKERLPMKPQREVASFVLRFTQDLWQDSQGEPRVEWRGQVRHVQNGEELRFHNLADAVTFIQDALLNLTKNCIPTDDKIYQEKAMQESFKLWEKFAQNYTSMIVEAVQQTVKQSEAIQKQMNEAVGRTMQPWWLMGVTAPATGQPAPTVAASEQTQLLQTLVALQTQIEALNAKVSKLEELQQAHLSNPLDAR
jgi:hypothetical protein